MTFTNLDKPSNIDGTVNSDGIILLLDCFASFGYWPCPVTLRRFITVIVHFSYQSLYRWNGYQKKILLGRGECYYRAIKV